MRSSRLASTAGAGSGCASATRPGSLRSRSAPAAAPARARVAPRRARRGHCGLDRLRRRRRLAEIAGGGDRTAHRRVGMDVAAAQPGQVRFLRRRAPRAWAFRARCGRAGAAARRRGRSAASAPASADPGARLEAERRLGGGEERRQAAGADQPGQQVAAAWRRRRRRRRAPASAATGKSSALRPKPRVKSWKGLAAIIKPCP